MTQPIFVIRPQPGCAATVEAGRDEGLEIEACPLFEIQPVAWSAPPPEEVDAVLLGSANAIRHGGPELERLRGKPAYAVGATTAAAAEAAGLPVAAVGQGGLQDLLDHAVSAPMRLLRLAGEEHVALEVPAGIEIATRIVYRSVALPLPDAVAERLEGGLVLLHSAAAAGHFAAEWDRCGVPRSAVAIAALGPRIAAAAGSGWQAVRASEAPSEAALLALARDMCHDRP